MIILVRRCVEDDAGMQEVNASQLCIPMHRHMCTPLEVCFKRSNQ
jgi:hypothetical protein